MRLLLIPVVVLLGALYIAVLVVVSVLHLLFQGLHLHWLAKNMTDPLLDQFIRLGEWGKTLVEQAKKETP